MGQGIDFAMDGPHALVVNTPAHWILEPLGALSI